VPTFTQHHPTPHHLLHQPGSFFRRTRNFSVHDLARAEAHLLAACHRPARRLPVRQAFVVLASVRGFQKRPQKNRRVAGFS